MRRLNFRGPRHHVMIEAHRPNPELLGGRARCLSVRFRRIAPARQVVFAPRAFVHRSQDRLMTLFGASKGLRDLRMRVARCC